MAITGTLPLLGLLAGRARNQANRVYEMLSSHNNLGEHSMYLNLGYWDGPETYDAACQRLAEVLGEAAALGPQDELLDVGFGFADQDMYWSKRFDVRRITGLNITRSQVETARRRVAEAGLSDRIDLREGSATAMPLPESSFTAVTALETAFHYDTREAFFREALRVLKPGGRLATADIIPRSGLSRGIKARIGEHFARAFWQIPAENLYNARGYAARLRRAGFVDVSVRSIRDQVYLPFMRFAARRLVDPDVAQRFNWLVRAFWLASVRDESAWDSQDYIIATARKPTA